MEKDENTAATEQAKDNFAGFDDVTKEGGEEVGFKQVEDMPKEASSEKGFEELEKELSNESKSEQKDDKKEEKDGEKAPEVTAETTPEAKKADPTAETKEVSDEDKAPELEVDPTKFTLEKADETGESESTWTTLGKDLGIEVKEDTHEAFKAAIEEEKQRAREEGKTEAYKIELEKFSPQAQRVIDFLNADPKNTIDSYQAPLKQYDAVLSLDNEAIIRKDYELQGWDTERIDEKLEILKDNGQLDNQAYELRKTVENLRNNAEIQISQDAVTEAQQRQTALQEQYQKENKEVLSVLAETKTFMGFKVPDNVRQYIQKQWESGEVRKAFQSSPKDVVEFMLNKYLGQDALKELKKTSFQKGRDDIQGKLHNLKDLSSSETSGRREPTKGKQAGAGGFDAWDEVEKDNASVDSNGY